MKELGRGHDPPIPIVIICLGVGGEELCVIKMKLKFPSECNGYREWPIITRSDGMVCG